MIIGIIFLFMFLGLIISSIWATNIWNNRAKSYDKWIEDMKNKSKEYETKKKEFYQIYSKMTQKEQQEFILSSSNGWSDGKTAFMGKITYDQYYDFRDKMIKKYNKLKR